MAIKIVLVEDEQFLLEMYKMKFTADGYEVYTASNGVEALKVIAESKPDIVLLDLVMPKMDGYETLKHLRADAATAKLKVYLLSNLGQTGEIDRGVKEGANGYFVKSSMTPSQLSAEVKKVLGQ
ncbi:response regulator [Candidatus Falkowbacteria bacterium CG10_big_fil_rev_8_21_14_0_10_37_14]|uniref:Response regulator n=1 Tax=Candidatus Falkowbacteria bacterium CG10_big_fil_rev_8_21_14_0_10_37_14 TaxID=1974561 RepID=A0A2M6WUH0_9BACT|nr:response regulator [Candidatus Falkowbacteria bacterium]OIO47223.1 MAG: hypothetical protein AUJ28_01095 [Parcubacteria group bacterium CG1_02_37_51]PIT96434.1 MAG: response regulator [Candidatus Falkowbacteria bacterium CG10_big_fil_rev_8_21_14_0_10_37_14]